MFTVGICDDEQIHRDNIKEMCERFCAEYSQSFDIVEFASGEEVLAYQNADFGKLHLLFLDIEMDGTDGLEVLRKVENADRIWRVVFVSSHEEQVWDTFSIKTLGFVRKPVEYQHIEKWLKVALRENKENVVLEYMEGIQKNFISQEDIYCLEAAGNYIYLHEKDNVRLVNDNLKQWQKKTEGLSLVRVHKSYMINMLHVRKWEAGKVILNNGEEHAIGRQFAKKAKESYLAFVKKQALGRM